MGIRVTVDRDECTECGVCWGTCPEVFEPGDDGLTQITEAYRAGGDLSSGSVPDDMEDCVVDSADGCPVEIIHVAV